MSRTLQAQPRRPPPRHGGPPRHHYWRLIAVLVVVAVGATLWRNGSFAGLLGGEDAAPGVSPTGGATGQTTEPGATTGQPSASQSPSPSESPTPVGGLFDGPINTAFPGLTTFRGNASRSYYGEGPLPADPEVLWRYPETGGMCSESTNLGVTKLWCGMGWTGQPNVIEHEDGTLELRFGAYDSNYHFLDAMTGEPLREEIVTGDLTKGSATSDPDGFPLYYGGSRDNYLRIIAVDRAQPEVLWKLHADSAPNPVWNNDWDGAPLIIGDYLLEGGENSWFYVIKLNRGYDAQGRVKVNPKIVMMVPGYDQELLSNLGDDGVSIENSVAFRDGVAYFANSGGLVQGWDISDILNGGTEHERVFRFWNGDETDASIVIDEEGYLYVGRHRSFNIPSRGQGRAQQIGSLMKLDPTRPNNPVVWDVQIGGFEPDGGILGTPAVYKGVVYVLDTAGALVAVDQHTGRILWEQDLPGPTWSSPVPIDDQILVADCAGTLHNFDISDPTSPPTEIWSVQLDESCIEATPAVWKGMIFVGTRSGAIYAVGDASG